MKEKVLIYPFDFESAPIVRYSKFLQDMEIVSLVSPRGWVMGDKFVYDKEVVDISNDFSTQLEKCSLVWFVESNLKLDFDKVLVPKMKEAVAKNKKILISRILDEKEVEQIKEIVPSELIVHINNEYSKDELLANNLYEIKTPVVIVCGLFSGTMKFDLQMALREEFLKEDIKLLQVGTKKYSKLFGIEAIPDFMFANGVSERDKIIKFNHFLKNKELETKIDLILLGIPGELTGLKANIFEDLGIYAFEMLRALSPDVVILCMPFEQNTIEKRTIISKSIEEVFQMNIDYFNIVPKKIDVEQSEIEKKITYVMLDEELILKRLNEKDVFCTTLKSEQRRLATSILELLNEYGKCTAL